MRSSTLTHLLAAPQELGNAPETVVSAVYTSVETFAVSVCMPLKNAVWWFLPMTTVCSITLSRADTYVCIYIPRAKIPCLNKANPSVASIHARCANRKSSIIASRHGKPGCPSPYRVRDRNTEKAKSNACESQSKTVYIGGAFTRLICRQAP